MQRAFGPSRTCVALFIGGLAVVSAVETWWLFLQPVGTPRSPVGPQARLVDVGGDVLVQQTFRVEAAGLDLVRLYPEPRNDAPPVEVVFEIARSGKPPEIIHRLRRTLADVTRRGVYDLTFPPIDDSGRSEVALTISAPGAVPGDLRLWMNAGGRRSDGRLHAGGKEQWGELAFATGARAGHRWARLVEARPNLPGVLTRRPLGAVLLLLYNALLATVVWWAAGGPRAPEVQPAPPRGTSPAEGAPEPRLSPSATAHVDRRVRPVGHGVAGRPLSRRSRALIALGLLIVGAASFSLVFRSHLDRVPAADYEARDDAVVTLSHARNLVEYGFIGVSPSGERIEGFSAPLQFWIAAAVYAGARFEYRTFLRWQTAIGLAVLGAMFAGLLWFPARDGQAWRLLFVVFAVVASAQVLATSRVFLLWHASGMENVYKSTAIVALVWAIAAMLQVGRTHWAAIPLVFVTTLTRIDSIVPVAALLAAWVVLWWLRRRNGHPLVLVVAGLLPWVLYMTWRVWYFGQWAPNTAVAHGISVANRLTALLESPRTMLLDVWQWLVSTGRGLHAFQFAWLPVLLFLVRRERAALDRCVLLVAGGLACVAQYVLFGPVRMDSARTVTELAVYATALVPFVLLARATFRARDLVAGVLIVSTSVAIAVAIPPGRTEIGWGTTWFEQTADAFDALARRFDIPRPTVANPDLGAMSWRKHFNVIDIGRLGSAVVPRIESPGRYLSEFAKPDIIQIHDSWSCRHRDLFTTGGFAAEYLAITAARTPWLAANCPGAPEAVSGIWIRSAVMKDAGTLERRFLEAFRSTLDVALVQAELSRCEIRGGLRPCDYVGRTVVRFVPELKDLGRFEEVARLLARNGALRAEHAFFVSSVNPDWWKSIVEMVQPVRAGLRSQDSGFRGTAPRPGPLTPD